MNNHFGNVSDGGSLSTLGLSEHELDQIANIGNCTLSNITWTNLSTANQPISTSSTPQFTRLGIGGPADGAYALNINNGSIKMPGGMILLNPLTSVNNAPLIDATNINNWGVALTTTNDNAHGTSIDFKYNDYAVGTKGLQKYALGVAATGKVGIGQAAGTEALTVGGNVLLPTGNALKMTPAQVAAEYTCMDFRDDGGNGIYATTAGVSMRGHTLTFRATDYNNGGTKIARELIYLSPTGNVGIGQDAGTNALEITGGLAVNTGSISTPNVKIAGDALLTGVPGGTWFSIAQRKREGPVTHGHTVCCTDIADGDQLIALSATGDPTVAGANGCAAFYGYCYNKTNIAQSNGFMGMWGSQSILTWGYPGSVGINQKPDFTNALAITGSFKSSGSASCSAVNVNSPTTTAPLSVSTNLTTSPLTNGACVMQNTTGNANAHAIMSVRTNGSTSGNPMYSMDIHGQYGYVIGIDNADADKLKIAGTFNDLTTNTRVTLDMTGKFGIGTVSPSEVLDVAGNIRATGALKLVNSTFPLTITPATLTAAHTLTIPNADLALTAYSGPDQSVSTTGVPQFTKIGVGAPASGSYAMNVVGDASISGSLTLSGALNCSGFTPTGMGITSNISQTLAAGATMKDPLKLLQEIGHTYITTGIYLYTMYGCTTFISGAAIIIINNTEVQTVANLGDPTGRFSIVNNGGYLQFTNNSSTAQVGVVYNILKLC